MKGRYEAAHYIASLAQRAILYEVSTTPKPGLVDRENSGAHSDMDFFTFMASSSALYRGMFECASMGLDFVGKDKTVLMNKIRQPGLECEKAMFEATGGINTHKGIIFSLGTLCAVVGKLYMKCENWCFTVEDICLMVKEVAKDLVSKDFHGIESKTQLTHGEKLFKEYGYTGIRGEVEGGFTTVQVNAIPVIREWSKSHQLSMNDMFLQVLLNIMAHNEDTNVITRGGIEGLELLKRTSRDFIKSGGMTKPEAREQLDTMNKLCIMHNLSPGGSADLLAVSIFLSLVEGIIH